MKVKTCPARIKAAGPQDGTDEGVFEAIVATYALDSVGDKIVPGAFAETLQEWKSSGDPIPVLWSHMSQDPDYHIGYVEDAEERPEGLWVRARIDLDEAKAVKVYKLLKGKRVRQFSFAYDVLEGGWIDQADADGGGCYELRKLKLYEVGPTLIGANQATELLTVKATDTGETAPEGSPPAETAETEPATAHKDSGTTPPATKAGRVLSAKNETSLRAALEKIAAGADAITSVLAALNTDDDSKATPAAPPASTETPTGATEASPARPGTASIRLQRDLDLLAVEIDQLTS